VAVLLVAVVAFWRIGRAEFARLIRMRYFQVVELTVEGNLRVPTAVIIRNLGLPARATILELDLRELSGRLVRNPWIETASVSRRLPGRLEVRVVERLPRAVVLTDRAYLVSGDGLVLKEADPVEVAQLPVLRLEADRPPHTGDRIDTNRLEQGARLWERLPDSSLAPTLRAREIRLERDGSLTIVPEAGMPSLRVRDQTWREQLERLAWLARVRGLRLESMEYADLRFANKVIVKPRLGEGGA
jgi:cell division protein FtsQ